MSRVIRHLWDWLRSHRWAALVTFLYAAFTAVVFRAGFGGSPGQLAEGTNILNAFTFYWWEQRFPIGTWQFPYTDWGQPFPAFTGPTLFTPFILTIQLTVLLRGIEFAAFVGSGLSMYWVVRRVRGTPLGAGVAGFYYLVMNGTPEFFEGHLPTMVSLAVAPLFLFLLYRFLLSPSWRSGIATAILLYILVAVGDLGALYFLLFFAILLSAFALIRRNATHLYSRREAAAFVGSLGLFVILMLSWLIPYGLGARPEYTTNVVVNFLPFSQTAGESLSNAFLGAIHDNSYVALAYGQDNYALGGRSLFPLFLLVPVTLAVYVLVARRTERILLWLSGLVAAVFATGPLYPGLSAFNEVVYDHVPYFNAIPALFRWAVYTILVQSILIGLLVSDLQRAERFRATQVWGLIVSRVGRPGTNLSPHGGIPPSPPSQTIWKAKEDSGHGRWPRPRRADSAALVAFALSIALLVLLQNALLVSRPPGVFVIPSEFTTSNGFLARGPVQGEVLEVPFGGVYSITSWGGVSSSPALLTPVYTGADTVIFQAGTPYSLAMDRFIGDGLTLGDSRNETKLLAGMNVEYVVATKYPNFSQISSSEYPTDLSYYALQNQTGMGRPVFTGGAQTVYRLPNYSGNVSFHPAYILYFGDSNLLYRLLDQQWYAGSNETLVDGGTVGVGLNDYLVHATAVVVGGGGLPPILPAGRAAFVHARIPLISIPGPGDFNRTEAPVVGVPWNASGGLAAQFQGTNASIGWPLSNRDAQSLGYTSANISVRAWCPPGPPIRVAIGNRVSTLALGPSIVGESPLNLSVPGFVAARVVNATGPYDGTVRVERVGSSDYLNWTFDSNSSAFQYLSFHPVNFSGWDGVSADVKGNSKIPLVWRLAFNGTHADFPFYENLVPIPTTQSSLYSFYPAGGSGAVKSVLGHLGGVGELELGVPPHTPGGNLVLGNVSLFNAPSGPERMVPVGQFPVTPAATVNLSDSAPCEVSAMSVVYGPTPAISSPPADKDVAPMPDPTLVNYAPTIHGWGIAVLAETYHDLFRLSASGATVSHHSVANVGLNGWLVNVSPGARLTFTYLGSSLERGSLIVEGGAGAVFGLAGVVYWRLHRRSDRAASKPAGEASNIADD